MLLAESVLHGDELVEMLWTASLAGLGVTAAYGIGLAGSTRAVDSRRAGRMVEAVLFGLIGLLALAVVVASIVFAIVVMTTK